MLHQLHLLYPTANRDRFDGMRRIVSGTGIALLSPADVFLSAYVKDRSRDPAENARCRASAYYRKGGVPTLCVETGLYIDGIEEKEQPGAKYRQLRHLTLRDEDCVDYYAALANRLGGKTMARFSCAACLIINEALTFEKQGEELSPKPFWLTAQVHPKRISGNPLLSLAVNVDSGHYLVEGLEEILTLELIANYQSFFRTALQALTEAGE